MLKLSVFFLLFSVFFLFSSSSIAQDSNDFHVVHVQTNKLKGMMGDDAEAFNELIVRQTGVINADSRVIRSYTLRHYWGDDSRDLVLVTEFKNIDDLFSFYDDLDSLLEKAMSKEQLDADNELWGKYVGQHSDEIYRVVNNTTK